MEAEKRIRREIANSNERRRMQSINAGFNSLRTLLPRHEGEKLSKAAILQQTAEYIYSLEQEKTRLLSQNSYLKRQLSQHDGGDVALKKRKAETLPGDCAALSDASDDASGGVPAEPTLSTKISGRASVSPSPELVELRSQLERERRTRALLEDQLRSFESPIYPDGLAHQITLQYDSSEALDRDDAMRDAVSAALIADDPVDCVGLAVGLGVGMDSVDDPRPPPLDVGSVEEPVEAPPPPRPASPARVAIAIVEDVRPPSPTPPVRAPLPEAAAAPEPEVKVEVLPGPGPASPGEPSRLFLASTSRQNLETIVEAIRHLEGDHMFAEERPVREQDLPLALTNKPDQQRRRRVDAGDFLHFHRPQARPGVIVAKHS